MKIYLETDDDAGIIYDAYMVSGLEPNEMLMEKAWDILEGTEREKYATEYQTKIPVEGSEPRTWANDFIAWAIMNDAITPIVAAQEAIEKAKEVVWEAGSDGDRVRAEAALEAARNTFNQLVNVYLHSNDFHLNHGFVYRKESWELIRGHIFASVERYRRQRKAVVKREFEEMLEEGTVWEPVGKVSPEDEEGGGEDGREGSPGGIPGHQAL